MEKQKQRRRETTCDRRAEDVCGQVCPLLSVLPPFPSGSRPGQLQFPNSILPLPLLFFVPGDILLTLQFGVTSSVRPSFMLSPGYNGSLPPHHHALPTALLMHRGTLIRLFVSPTRLSELYEDKGLSLINLFIASTGYSAWHILK